MTAVQSLRELFQNTVFLSTAVSLFAAQILKMVFYFLTNKERKIKEGLLSFFWRTGGMPSSHSAAVCALAASVGITEGFPSNYFVISLVLALIVLRDAVGVRRAAGLQAKAINSLGRQAKEKTGAEFFSVKEVQGHTPAEVIAGSILGILTAVLFCLFF